MIKKYNEFINEEFFWKKKELNVDIEVNRFIGRMKAIRNFMDMYNEQDPDFWRNPDIRDSINKSSEALGDFMKSVGEIMDSRKEVEIENSLNDINE